MYKISRYSLRLIIYSVSKHRQRPNAGAGRRRAASWRPLEYCIAPQHAGPPPARPAPPRSLGPTGDYAGWWVMSEEYKLRYTFYGNNKQQAITASVRGSRGRGGGGWGERVGGRCSTSGVRGNTALIHMGECLVTHKNTFKFWPRALHCIHMKLSLFSCNAVRNMNHHEPMGEVHR